MGEEVLIPSPEEQMKLLSLKLPKSAVQGETWYLISTEWLKRLKQFIGMHPNGDLTNQPGPVDNRSILTDDLKDLKKGLAEALDYDIIPAECWKLLTEWYGVVPQQVPITRKAILMEENYTHVEVYLIELKCYKNFDREASYKLKVSRADLVSHIHAELRKEFEIDDSVPSKLWKSVGLEKREILDLGVTVYASGLGDNHTVILDTKMLTDNNGRRKILFEPKTYSSHMQPSTSRTNLTNLSLRSRSSMQAANPLLRFPGVCGLYNLGYTCFINSVVQCLSNSPPLNEYFMTEKHLKELNTTNPLGMKGEIAKSFGNLIRVMWSGKDSTTTPLQFKLQVSKFSALTYPQQHDAQEFLTFLLDAMHEDLNRIIVKPYIENKDYTGQEDQIIAKESWENYKKRNDSIVVDTFHGLLKSRVVCPQCERLSVTFDPFCSLSLPLPLKKEKFLKIRFIPYTSSMRERLYRVTVPRRGLVKDLCKEIGLQTNTDPCLLLTVEINNSHFHKFYTQDESLEHIDDKDTIYIYEMVDLATDPNYMIVPICFWELCKPSDTFMQTHLFGVPIIIILPKNDLRYNTITEEIVYHMKRHFDLPEVGYNEYGDNPDSNVTYEPSLFLYDSGSNKSPLPLNFGEDGNCLENLPELMDINNPDRVFGRKIFLVQLSVDERRDYFAEQSADYGTDLNVSRKQTRDKSNLAIYDCFDLFTTCEKLGEHNAWFCSTCKKHQRATKKFDIWKLPKILIIHLKRFSFYRGCDKIDVHVEYPLDNLDLNKYVINSEEQNISYNLIGIIDHFGTMSNGHYTSYCKNRVSSSWYCFNDDSVSPVGADELLVPSAYVLFYYRNDSKNSIDTPMDINYA